MQSGREDTLEERYGIKFRFKLGKDATETYGMLQTAFQPSCMNRASVFEWHKRFKKGRKMRGVGGVRKSIDQSWLAKGLGLGLGLVCWGFKGILEEASTLQIGSVAFPPGHNFILVTVYLTKMRIKALPQLLYSPDVAPCDLWLFPKLRGCPYDTIEMKEGMM